MYKHLEAALVSMYLAHCVIKKGRKIRDQKGSKKVLYGCAQNYSGKQFIAPILVPNPIPRLDTCTTRDSVNEIHRSYVGTIS